MNRTPRSASRLAWRQLAAKLPGDIRDSLDAVVSPAMGGIIIGQEMGRALGLDAMFLERPEGEFHLRRGFFASRARTARCSAVGVPLCRWGSIVAAFWGWQIPN